VPVTDDPEVARIWCDTLRAQGVEGIVASPASSSYRAARIWKKLRHSDVVDLTVAGFTGSYQRPRAVVVELPEGRRALSQRLDARTAADIAAHLAQVEPGGLARTATGEVFTTIGPGLVVEAAAGSTRHAVVTVTRVR